MAEQLYTTPENPEATGTLLPAERAAERPLLVYWLAWMAPFLLLRLVEQVAAAVRQPFGALSVLGGLLFPLVFVGPLAVVFGALHLELLRALERRRAQGSTRTVASLGLGLLLALAAGGAVFLLFQELATGAMLQILLPCLLGGHAVARSWKPSDASPGSLRYGPVAAGAVGASAGGVLVFWGLLLLSALMGRMGNLSGLLEFFLAVPAAAIGGITGAVLGALNRHPSGTARPVRLRDRMHPAPVACVAGTLALAGAGTAYLRMLAPTSMPRQHSLDPRQEQAASTVATLGGWAQVDASQPSQPVVSIDFHQKPVADADLAVLASFPHLQKLNLDMTRITDAGLVHLEGLTELRELQLNAVRVRGPGLVHLKGMSHLRTLGLGGSTVTDDGLAHLEGLTELRSLYLFSTGISDGGVAHLKRLKHLQELNLNGARITDAGLAQLEGLTELQTLRVDGAQVTDAGKEALRKHLPRARINPRGGVRPPGGAARQGEGEAPKR
jgi:hypothetical protein